MATVRASIVCEKCNKKKRVCVCECVYLCVEPAPRKANRSRIDIFVCVSTVLLNYHITLSLQHADHVNPKRLQGEYFQSINAHTTVHVNYNWNMIYFSTIV